MTDRVDTTPMGSYLKAESFRRAAMLLAQQLRGGSFDDSPIRFNYYHSIELYLKGALICDGATDDDLRKEFRHGFRKLADAANERGFGLSEESDLQTLDLIDHDGNYLRSRYHRRGAFQVAAIEFVNSTAHECAILCFERLKRTGLPARPPAPAIEWDERYPS